MGESPAMWLNLRNHLTVADVVVILKLLRDHSEWPQVKRTEDELLRREYLKLFDECCHFQPDWIHTEMTAAARADAAPHRGRMCQRGKDGSDAHRHSGRASSDCVCLFWPRRLAAAPKMGRHGRHSSNCVVVFVPCRVCLFWKFFGGHGTLFRDGNVRLSPGALPSVRRGTSCHGIYGWLASPLMDINAEMCLKLDCRAEHVGGPWRTQLLDAQARDELQFALYIRHAFPGLQTKSPHRTGYLKMSVPDVCLQFSYLSFLTVWSHGRCSFPPQGRVVCTQGIVLDRLTPFNFVSHTTTETKGLFALCLVCANVTCLLSNCLDGKMKN